ncbi:MAG: DUF4417 domain-containing protein [Prevotella sp.]|nr:DUF4417 domain-containing protein [Prevotella sp.]
MRKREWEYENLQHAKFEGEGKYGIPAIKGSSRKNVTELIGFNSIRNTNGREGKGVHFFVDDYRFARVWNAPDKYIPQIKKFDFVMSPDFSLYTDFPTAMQIYNHYRKHWLAAYWESFGIEVIPTIGWSTADSFDWCFDGEPVGGTVAVSSVGTQNSKRAKELFLNGYAEMVRRLSPGTVIFYGNVPDECRGNIIQIKPFQEKFKEVKCDGRQRCKQRDK